METTKKVTNITDLKAVPFKMKKTLIPIDRYAQRESLSMDIIEQCGKIGLLQIRKCKGEVFVVDTPFDAFGSRDEILADVNSQIKQQKQAAELKKQPSKQNPVEATSAQASKPVAAVQKTAAPAVKPQNTSQPYKAVANCIAEKELQKNTTKPKKTSCIEDDEPIEIDEIINTEILSGPKSDIKPEDFGININEIDELINEKNSLLDYQQSYYEKSRNAAIPQKNWTTAAIISALCLSFSLMCCFWLYLDSQMQKEKTLNLRIDNARLQKSISNANLQTAGIRNEFTEANRKISELTEQINNLQIELTNTKNQLELATEQIRQTTLPPQPQYVK